MPSIEEFGKKLKEKYPQYNAIDDRELGLKMLEKHPEYKDRVFDTDPNTQAQISGVSQAQPEQQGIIGTIKKGFTGLKDTLSGRVDKVSQIAGSDQNIGSKILQTAGQGFATIGDTLGAAIGTTASVVTPDDMEEKIKQKFSQGVSAVAGTDTAQKVVDFYRTVKEKHPELVGNTEAIGNIVDAFANAIGVGAGAKGAKVAVKAGAEEVANLASDTAKVAKKVMETSEESVNKMIDTNIEKGIRPSVAGTKNFAQIEKYKEKARNAVLTITRNKDKLRLTDDIGEVVSGAVPETLKQFSEAIGQTKEAIYKKYNKLATQAGEAGAKIKLTGIADELSKLAESPVLQDVAPEVVAYAKKRGESLIKRGEYTAEQAQEAIKQLNSSLESFYRNPTAGEFSRLQVDALIVNNMRESLDAAITSAKGAGYQKLKEMYGALKTIEKDVYRRAVVDARKNNKGLVDFADVFSAGDIILGVTTMNAAQVAKGGFQMFIKEMYKRRNDPNNIIKKMFKGAEKYIKNEESSTETFVPKSYTGRTLQSMKGKGGLSIQDVTKQPGYDPLLQEARKYKSAEEFVKAQPTIYRGGTSDGKYFSTHESIAADFAKNRGGSVSEHAISPEAKVVNYDDIPTAQYKGINDYNMERYGSGKDLLSFQNGKLEADYTKAEKWAKQNGYDAVKFPTEGEIRVINDKAIVPKSQLTDLWKKAQGEGGKKYIQGEGGKMKGSVTGMNENIGKVKDGAKKIKERILNEMADFTEYAAKQKNGEKIEYVLDEIRARKIAEQLGINPDVSNWELSKKFGKILEKYNYIR